ncbi:phage tail terminator protein [Acidovorax sp. NCPPB 3576]|uniref:phage tail terminator protein n=1 Tax=Acidovorax sp. NCPPB 3576 TaxID=2940488 RepID=UPI00234C0005|nr:hypothetical protein [Acidovorax sp. NCPPB 3576]WCM88522.1 hypothetical protein M5C98_00200 [Acidovorax sp. NCPPB 3576]
MATAPIAPAHPNNFLEPEPHIVDRLKEALRGLQPAVHVLTATDLSGIKEENQPTPAVHVVWNGFRVLEARADGAAARLDHTWLIVAAVRNVRTLKTGEAVRAQAGELAARAGAALMGYRPPNVAGPMRLAPAPGSGISAAGFMYLPLAFLVETVFQR